MRYVLKNDGTKEPFDPLKLKSSLEYAGASVITREEVVEDINNWLIKPATTTAIYKRAFGILRKKKEGYLALRYSLRRSIAEFGPTGFPFEQFVAAILRKKGYEVETGRMVEGACVDHEVDVVAWNDHSLVLCEVKFHSELGAKSDLKVALYIDARFEDLKEADVDTPQGKRKMTDGLLITNTKFTEKAVRYGTCAGVNLIGWNYPAKGNLHDLISETGIHPITCLPSLTLSEKKFLLENKVVNCFDLKDNRELIERNPTLKAKQALIYKDIEELCT